jgi:hypothetical protein
MEELLKVVVDQNLQVYEKAWESVTVVEKKKKLP